MRSARTTPSASPGGQAVTTVALDGRGAEGGPDVIVAGARAAAADGIAVRVFGDPSQLSGLDGIDGVELVEAPDEITNDDDPVASVRGTPQSSIVLAAADVADGRSQALASAGPTGATMTAALFALRRMHGVRRPALTVQLPVPGRTGPPTILLDVGANTEARAGRPRPVRLPRLRLQPGGARDRPPAGGAAVGRRGGQEGVERRRGRP